jgi:hypothetical protein
MKDYLVIGSVPSDEFCVQIGDENYRKESVKECERFIKQLKEEFGNPPVKAELKIKSFNHDFGEYFEVVCYYDDTDDESTEYCYLIESDMPEKWKDI